MAGEDDDDLNDIEVADTGDAANDDVEDEGETVIAFADEADEDDDEEAEPTPLVKRLREQLREAHGKLAKVTRNPTPANDGDPEPQVPDEPGSLDTFEYDEDKQREAWRKHKEATQAHAEWKLRQSEREAERNRNAERQAKQIEQQRNSLGVADYEDRAALVKDRLSEGQMAVIIQGAQNPARLIYALGRSPSKLELVAAEENLARFATTIGAMERDIKVTKRSAPAADTRVRGATASPALNDRNVKMLKKLEAEAERTGDRTALIKFKKAQKAA